MQRSDGSPAFGQDRETESDREIEKMMVAAQGQA